MLEKSQKQKNIILTVIIVFIIAVIAFILIFVTLSVHSRKNQTNHNLSSNYIVTSVMQKMNYKNLSEISPENISKYYEIPDGVVSEASMYVSSRSDSFTELACFKLTDKSQEDALVKSVSEYISSKNNSYNGINGKEYQNISNGKTAVSYPYVFVVISSDSDAAVSAFNLIIENPD